MVIELPYSITSRLLLSRSVPSGYCQISRGISTQLIAFQKSRLHPHQPQHWYAMFILISPPILKLISRPSSVKSAEERSRVFGFWTSDPVNSRAVWMVDLGWSIFLRCVLFQLSLVVSIRQPRYNKLPPFRFSSQDLPLFLP